MKVVERRIQRVSAGKWEQAMALERKWADVERELNPPPKRSLRPLIGADMNTLVWEREWDTVSALDAHYMHSGMMNDPKAVALQQETAAVFESMIMEVYVLLD